MLQHLSSNWSSDIFNDIWIFIGCAGTRHLSKTNITRGWYRYNILGTIFSIPEQIYSIINSYIFAICNIQKISLFTLNLDNRIVRSLLQLFHAWVLTKIENVVQNIKSYYILIRRTIQGIHEKKIKFILAARNILGLVAIFYFLETTNLAM